MLTQIKNLVRRTRRQLARATMVGTALVVAGIVAFGQPAPASAHCDSVEGPVVNGARKALDTGDAKWVLAYVKPAAEPELTAAFQQTLAVRQASPEAKELADHYFFETAVRLHRVGEGAAYTGLKETTDFGPALETAEKALETNSLTDVHVLLNKALEDGLAKQYHMVTDARAKAAQDPSLEALREQAEAELVFEKYVDALYQAALGNVTHAEGTAAAHAEPAAETH